MSSPLIPVQNFVNLAIMGEPAPSPIGTFFISLNQPSLEAISNPANAKFGLKTIIYLLSPETTQKSWGLQQGTSVGALLVHSFMNQTFLKGTFAVLKFLLKLDQSITNPARKTQKPSKKFLTKLDQGTCDQPKKTPQKVFFKRSLWKLEKGVSMTCLMSTYYQVTFIKFI